ncbi:plasmid SOS inhibition protein A [Enterobacteriaceae bacterium H11S18]|uniref:plasmid SOS inhibition protein A n=1 Tax=Dryocola clanedunensis TaxID=2925396 RepID=UPI0022F08F55|nr:plasmid SOS inhibition protein A [Dryocola clanedunensis]MCT4709203.1 plasmid SOS inhibition protein A [Dryocola clanedunensis]
MIPSHLSLIPLHEGRRAALRAVGEIENKRLQGKRHTEYPWAKAFFRHLTGSKRIILREINYFAPVLTERELRGCKDSWIRAIDTLIESRGTCCFLPLSTSAAYDLFPETLFRDSERSQKQQELRSLKYSRQCRRKQNQAKIALQARVGQAEIDLAFQTPETVNAWCSRWRQTAVSESMLDDMFFRWSERFPSLKSVERWQWENEPRWTLMYEVQALAKEATPQVRVMERWMVPNKLTYAEAAGIG